MYDNALKRKKQGVERPLEGEILLAAAIGKRQRPLEGEEGRRRRRRGFSNPLRKQRTFNATSFHRAPSRRAPL
jgi:hypothetical protein